MADCRIIQGNALTVVKGFEPGTYGAVITDPPYSSGGVTLADKSRSTAEKYTSLKRGNPIPSFEGDSKDQRSWANWMAEILTDCRAACIPGAPIVLFTDWRQLPSLTDAMQWAGWIWRGIAVWDKVNSRPQRGRFRQQGEFVVWGSNGPMPVTRDAPVIPGVISCPMPTGKQHQTQKPLELMRTLVRITEPGKRILDPFAGSGTTVLAAQLEGYDADGIEIMPYFAGVARRRLEDHQ